MTWRYYVHDLRSNAFIAELPFVNVDFNVNMPAIKPGDFTAQLRIGDDRVAHTNWRDAVGVLAADGQRRVYSELNGVLIGCHVLFDPTYDFSSKTWTVIGTELWNYFHHRVISHDRVYSGAEQLDIVRDLLRQEFTEPGGDIGLVIDSTTVSGALRDRTYLAADGKDLAEAVEQLAAVINGFDFRIDISYDTNLNRVCKLVFGYPRLGRDDSGVYFRLPGDMLTGFAYARKGSQRALRTVALGASGLRQDAIDLVSVNSGLALLELVKSYTSVTLVPTLAAHAQADLFLDSESPTTFTVPVQFNQDPVLGSYQLGDNVWVQIEEASGGYFTPPWKSEDGQDHRLSQKLRLVGLHIRPDTNTVDLQLDTTTATDLAVAAGTAIGPGAQGS